MPFHPRTQEAGASQAWLVTERPFLKIREKKKKEEQEEEEKQQSSLDQECWQELGWSSAGKKLA